MFSIVFFQRGKKFKIWFLPGENDAVEYNVDLSNAIGVVVRTTADIKEATGWKGVSKANKSLCYTRLQQWFEIEGWPEKRVKRIIKSKFGDAFTRWRSTLNNLHKKFLEKDLNPRDVCPRPDLTMKKWLEACDFIEEEIFQKRSQVNSKNRTKKKFNHTSGKRTMLSRFKEMNEKSEIEHFKATHVSKSKDSEFIDPVAESKYNEMVELKAKAVENGKEIKESAIVRSVLGKRSGYIKGMGHGVQVNHGREMSIFAGMNLEKKLLKIESRMEKMQKILQSIPGIPSEILCDLELD